MVATSSFPAPLVVGYRISLQEFLREPPFPLSLKVLLVPSAIILDLVGAFEVKPALPLGDTGGT